MSQSKLHKRLLKLLQLIHENPDKSAAYVELFKPLFLNATITIFQDIDCSRSTQYKIYHIGRWRTYKAVIMLVTGNNSHKHFFTLNHDTAWKIADVTSSSISK